ncbi:hypothetical protein KFL_000460130 [Klebsormidium nitens]|uniref:Uncharacterized protein n=1 Tax=Klebsormidium nitens TaxID=105231 RepID=A0A1Y1HQN3_KLENI|nr:hypothetical protein KFL_000460130 [Klebsormidium nitens]|eukprot:GAQ80102.1 hypothetical protein KFL_000460130 [Klebsormidium nitens]
MLSSRGGWVQIKQRGGIGSRFELGWRNERGRAGARTENGQNGEEGSTCWVVTSAGWWARTSARVPLVLKSGSRGSMVEASERRGLVPVTQMRSGRQSQRFSEGGRKDPASKGRCGRILPWGASKTQESEPAVLSDGLGLGGLGWGAQSQTLRLKKVGETALLRRTGRVLFRRKRVGQGFKDGYRAGAVLEKKLRAVGRETERAEGAELAPARIRTAAVATCRMGRPG